MGAQVVEYDPDPFSVRVVNVDEVPHALGEVEVRALRCDLDVPPWTVGVDEREDIGGAAAPVLVVDVRQLAGPRTNGQYLAFIHLYTKLNRCPPAEADIQRYFGVTPPTVHSMVVTLEKHGLLRRQPGRARTLEVLIPSAQLPELR